MIRDPSDGTVKIKVDETVAKSATAFENDSAGKGLMASTTSGLPTDKLEVRKGLSSESIVAAVTKSLVDTASQEWRINVSFEAEKERR